MSQKYLSKSSTLIIMLSFCISLQQGASAKPILSCEDHIAEFLDECDDTCNTHTNRGSTPTGQQCRTHCGELHTWMEEHLCK